MTTFLAQVSEEDRTRAFMAVIRRDAVLANPTAYSQQETEDILRRWHQMLGEFVQRYEIDPLANWEYDIYTGNILDRGTT